MTDEKKPRELTVSAAVAKIKALDAAQNAETDSAIRAVGMRIATRYDGRRNAVIARVHPSAQAAVLREAGRELDSDVPPMTSEEIDEATSDLPPGARPYEPGPAARAAKGSR